MKIEFSRSGGFAAPAMRRKVDIDTNDRSVDDAQKLKQLISRADLARQRNAFNKPPLTMRFTIASPWAMRRQSYTRSSSDEEMPENLQPLID
jgi:hypothetical protein